MNSIIKTLWTGAAVILLGATQKAGAAQQQYYELKVYHIKTQSQQDRLDKYLKDAYLPVLHRKGLGKVGVFKTLQQDTDKRIYVLIAFKSLDQMEKTDQALTGDQQYLDAGKDYLDAAYNEQPYTRMETIVLKAFPKWPETTVPQLSSGKADRVYELRSYESPTEKLNINKVRMFNDGGETVLFNRLKFNAVFYAEVLAGSHMPNLMYMTAFENKADRDKHWETFGNDPEWKALVARPEYQHNVSKADIVFVQPAEYSDF